MHNVFFHSIRVDLGTDFFYNGLLLVSVHYNVVDIHKDIYLEKTISLYSYPTCSAPSPPTDDRSTMFDTRAGLTGVLDQSFDESVIKSKL